MHKKTILSVLLAAATGATLAADFYVVAPLPGKQHLVDGISVALSTTPLPTGVVGVPYAGFNLSSALQVSGDPAFSSTNVGWSVVAGALPAGLTMNKGVITGTPSAAGAQAFTVRATYKTKTGEQAYQLFTYAVTVALATGSLPQGVAGVAYPTYDLKPLLAVQGDPGFNPANVVWTVVSNTLPAGLTLKANGTIAGTPTASGTGAVTARANYKGVTGEQTYQVVTLGITVNLATETLPQGVAGVAYPAYDLKPLLAVAGDPSFNLANVTWTVVSSTLPAGLTLKADGTINGTPTAAGTGVITARASFKGINGQQTYQVVTLGVTVNLATATLPQGVAGVSYPTYDLKPLLTVAGDPSFTPANATWTVVSSTLPAGLTLKSDGTLSGTPTVAGTGAITARASFKGVNGEQTYQVVTLGLTVALATATLPQGVAGVAYPAYDLKPLLSSSGDPSFSGANVTWSVVSSTLPAGLTLKADGTLSGTPSASGTGTLVARATYRGIHGEQTYQVATLGITVSLATGTLPQGVVGVGYPTYDLKPLLTVVGDPSYNVADVNWSLASGVLPAGLTLSATGTISGTPTAANSDAVTVRATYKGAKGELAYQLVTLSLTVSLPTATLTQGVVGVAYPTYDFKPLLAVSGDAGYDSANSSWTVTGGSLLAGLSLSPSGVLAGTPTEGATKSFTVQAAYKGKQASQSYSLSAAMNLVLQAGGYRTWGNGSVAPSCKAYRQGVAGYAYAGATGDGVYRIDPDGAGAAAPVSVYCDMTTQGGGWTLVMTNNLPNFTNLAGTGTTTVCTSISNCNTGGTSSFYRGTPVEATITEFLALATSNGNPYQIVLKRINPAPFIRDNTPAPGYSLFNLMTDGTPGWAPPEASAIAGGGDRNDGSRMFADAQGLAWSDGNWHGTGYEGQQGMQFRLGTTEWGHHHYTGVTFDGANYVTGPWTFYPLMPLDGASHTVPKLAAETLYRWAMLVR